MVHKIKVQSDSEHVHTCTNFNACLRLVGFVAWQTLGTLAYERFSAKYMISALYAIARLSVYICLPVRHTGGSVN